MTKKQITVDDYIASFPTEIQSRLQSIRKVIQENAPQAQEGMAYGIPAYKYNNKPLVYFAGFEKHLGFYATPTGHAQFKKELSVYKQGKGSVQFPHTQDLPNALIAKIVLFRVKENLK